MHGGYAPVTTVLTTNIFAKADNHLTLSSNPSDIDGVLADLI